MRELVTAAAASAAALWMWKKKRVSLASLLLTLLLIAAGIICCLIRGFYGTWIPVSSVAKQEKGSIETRMEFRVHAEDQGQNVTLQIPSVEYSSEEARDSIEELLERLDQEILGENSSLLEICYPLTLRSAYEESPVTLQWQTDHPDYLTREGELGASIPQEGTEVLLTGELRLQDQTEVYQRRVRVYPSRDPADLEARLQAAAEEVNQDGESSLYQLPEVLDEQELHWFRRADSAGWKILFLALLLPVVLGLLGQEKQRAEQEKRREQLEQEYPELVSRIQMLLGAGLGMRMVLERIAAEYKAGLEWEKKKRHKRWKKRKGCSPVCEEILVSCRELENGLSESEVYRRFGARCGTPAYRGLALLLEQNSTKGGQGLLRLLEQESNEAFENRLRSARRKGEKVSVRLLLPMGMLLMIVLALVMIPAMMSL